MILQEKIQKKAEGFGKLAPVFLEGAKFALENQMILFLIFLMNMNIYHLMELHI